MSITKEIFGKIGENDAYLFTLKNENGVTVKITNYGATVVSLAVPDKNEKPVDVVLGYDTLDGYVNGGSSQGAVVGRYGNRIAGGKFTVDGVDYQLEVNSGVNHIHGGKVGYNHRLWNVLYTADAKEPALSLLLVDEDGTNGYPGTLKVNVVYTLTGNNELQIDYFATTDKKTILNLTNHSYFNLDGYASGSVLNQKLQIFADKITVTNKDIVTSGETREIRGSAFDFRKKKTIGQDINADDEQLIFGNGYDHNYITGDDKVMKYVARAEADKTGIVMDVFSDQPAMQFYTANFLNEKGKGGLTYSPRDAFCLETQHTPNSPNLKGFPSVTLSPDEKYHYTTIFKFSK